MKITKSKLLQIIKEELGLEMSPPTERSTELWKAFEDVVGEIVSDAYDAEDSDAVMQKMQNTISEFFADFESEQTDYEAGFKS